MEAKNSNEYLKYKGQFPKNSKIFLAMFIDLICFHLIIFTLLKLYALFAHSILDRYTVGRIGFMIYCVGLLSIPLFSAKAQTLGQFITKIQIRNVDGSKMSFLNSLKRWIYSIFSPVGYGQKPVPWYDHRTGSVCIKKINS